MLADEIKTVDLSIKEIVIHSWDIINKNFKTILIIFALLYIPVEIVAYFQKHVGAFLAMLASIFTSISIAYIVESSINGKEMDYKQAFKKTSLIFPIGIKTSLLGGLIIFGFFLLLIVPGIIWAVYYTFVAYAVALRDVRGKAALEYSKKLVEGRWWKVLLYCVAFGIITSIGAGLISVPFYFFDNALFDIMGDVNLDIAFSFFLIAEVIFFLNLDSRGNKLQTEPAEAVIDGQTA